MFGDSLITNIPINLTNTVEGLNLIEQERLYSDALIGFFPPQQTMEDAYIFLRYVHYVMSKQLHLRPLALYYDTGAVIRTKACNADPNSSEIKYIQLSLDPNNRGAYTCYNSLSEITPTPNPSNVIEQQDYVDALIAMTNNNPIASAPCPACDVQAPCPAHPPAEGPRILDIWEKHALVIAFSLINKSFTLSPSLKSVIQGYYNNILNEPNGITPSSDEDTFITSTLLMLGGSINMNALSLINSSLDNLINSKLVKPTENLPTKQSGGYKKKRSNEENIMLAVEKLEKNKLIIKKRKNQIGGVVPLTNYLNT
jgi:hypothetical protein